MKKIVCLCFAAVMAIVCIINYYNFAYKNQNEMYNGMCSILVEKPENTTKQKYLEDISKTAKNLNIDIALKASAQKGKLRIFYKTNNTENLFNIKTDSNNQILNAGQCFSTENTVENHTVIPMYISSVYTDTTIYPFEECISANLSNAEYCVKAEKANTFIDALNAKGYTASINDLPLALSGDMYNLTDYILCPFIILVLAMFIYIMDRGKQHVLKKLEGLSSANIIIGEIAGLALPFAVIFTAIQILNIGLFSLQSNNLLTEYIAYTVNSMLLPCLGIAFIALLLASLLVIPHNSSLYIKGKKGNGFVMYATALAKVITIIFICTPLINSLQPLPSLIQTYITSSVVIDKTESFVEANIYSNYTEEETEGLFNFYKATVKNNNGIYCKVYNYDNDKQKSFDNTVAFYNERLESTGEKPPYGLTVEEMAYLQCFNIDINSNYLNLNPIHKPDGTLVTKADFDENKFNIMVNENEKKEYIEAAKKLTQGSYKEAMDKKFGGKPIEFNVIYYRQDESFCLFNSSNDSNTIYAQNPIVYVKDGMGLKLAPITSWSNNEFIIETHTDNPYKELLPTIKECNLEGVITDFSSTADAFEDKISLTWDSMQYNVIKFIMYLALYIFIMVFFVKTYLQNYKNDIAIRRLSGEPFFTLHKRYFAWSAVMTAVTLISYTAIYIKLDTGAEGFFSDEPVTKLVLLIPIIIAVAEALIFKIHSEIFIQKSILKTLKGD